MVIFLLLNYLQPLKATYTNPSERSCQQPGSAVSTTLCYTGHIILPYNFCYIFRRHKIILKKHFFKSSLRNGHPEGFKDRIFALIQQLYTVKRLLKGSQMNPKRYLYNTALSSTTISSRSVPLR